jgi:hypothetical protein
MGEGGGEVKMSGNYYPKKINYWDVRRNLETIMENDPVWVGEESEYYYQYEDNFLDLANLSGDLIDEMYMLDAETWNAVVIAVLDSDIESEMEDGGMVSDPYEEHEIRERMRNILLRRTKTDMLDTVCRVTRLVAQYFKIKAAHDVCTSVVSELDRNNSARVLGKAVELSEASYL